MNLNKCNKIIVVMGVSGSGKSTIGKLLARDLSLPFIEGDDHHPKVNLDKMRSSIPLNDFDRLPWLRRLNFIAQEFTESGCVITCSALKKSYRDLISENIEKQTVWVHLKGEYNEIHSRLKKRTKHFMKANMLSSQFDILEEPINSIDVEIGLPLDQIINQIISKLK